MSFHWAEEYEDDQASRSKFVKNKSGVPVEMEFLSNEPEKKEFTKEGKTITSWNFPVKVKESGKQREKTLSVTSSRLMRLIIEEAKKSLSRAGVSPSQRSATDSNACGQ
jgi:hypothetical protein